MPGGGKRRPTWLKLSSIGFEFAAGVGGFALLGYWFDRWLRTAPWGLVVAVTLGLAGSTYNLIRTASRAFRESEAEDREKSEGPGS